MILNTADGKMTANDEKSEQEQKRIHNGTTQFCLKHKAHWSQTLKSSCRASTPDRLSTLCAFKLILPMNAEH